MATWYPGKNCPLVYRGKNGDVGPKLRMVIANLLWNLRDDTQLRTHVCQSVSASGDTPQATTASNVVARSTGLSAKTVFQIEAEMKRRDWAWHGNSKQQKRSHRLVTTDVQQDPSLPDSLPPLTRGDRGREVVATSRESGDEPDVGTFLPVLPKEEDEEEDGLGDAQPAVGGDAFGSKRLLAQWRSHPQYLIGMHQAEIATLWLSAGLPDNRWPEFITWLATSAPGLLGNVNHSWHWLREFGFSLTRTLLTNAAASLHSVVPALGMPSDIVPAIGGERLAGPA